MASHVIHNIDDALYLLKSLEGQYVGVSTYAFDKIIFSLLLKDKYKILCYKNNIGISDGIEIWELSSQLLENNRKNNKNILEQYMHTYNNTKEKIEGVIINKPSSGIESFAKLNKLSLCANSLELLRFYENKKNFRIILNDLCIDSIHWSKYDIKSFEEASYKLLSKKHPDGFVVQLTDVQDKLNAGGAGTFIIFSETEWSSAKEIIVSYSKIYDIGEIHIAPYIKGSSCSVIGCVTRYGILVGGIQEQIINMPELSGNISGGKFSGHTRNIDINKESYDAIETMTKKIGEHMKKKGYKGIFGIDFIINKETSKIYPLECNPRYTGAFPFLSLIDFEARRVPLDVFHFCECMDIDYRIDVDEINANYLYTRKGSHIILSNLQSNRIEIKNSIIPGIYIYDEEKIVYKRQVSIDNRMIQEGEFILLTSKVKGDIVPGCFERGTRMARLIFPDGICDQGGNMSKDIKKIVDATYVAMLSS